MMNGDYELLTEKESMWAEMLLEVLENNGIRAVSIPVFGAAMTLRGGARERLRVYVPASDLPKARELVDELFSAEAEE